MKVVQALGWYFPQSTGGTEVYVHSLAKHLQRSGIEVAVVAPQAGLASSASSTHDDVSVFRYPIPAAATRSEVRGEVTVRGAEHLHRWFALQKPDVVHFHTLTTGLDLAEIEAARLAGARVLFTAHTSALGYLCPRGTLMQCGERACEGMTPVRTCTTCLLQQRGVPQSAAALLAAVPSPVSASFDRVQSRLGSVLGMATYVAARRQRQEQLARRVQEFFVLTDWARRAVAFNTPVARVTVNRLGVDTAALGSRPQARAATGPLTIGFLGRLDPVKGLNVILRALASIPTANLRLDVRGIAVPQFSEVVSELQAAMSRDPRITYGGAVERGETARLLAGWDVLICPGISHEGGPTVALEALAVGTPVITSAFGGVAEILRDGENTRLLPPGDWRELAAVLDGLARAPEQLAAWREKLPPPRTMSDVSDQYLRAYLAA